MTNLYFVPGDDWLIQDYLNAWLPMGHEFDDAITAGKADDEMVTNFFTTHTIQNVDEYFDRKFSQVKRQTSSPRKRQNYQRKISITLRLNARKVQRLNALCALVTRDQRLVTLMRAYIEVNRILYGYWKIKNPYSREDFNPNLLVVENPELPA